MKVTKAERARNLRYKKAALASLSFESMTDELYNISSECTDIQYFMSDDESLVAALDGDEDDAYEFKMMFCELSAKCEQFDSDIRDSYVKEHFDDFMVGILGNKYNAVGYDSFEEDYFSLTRFEGELAQTESGKRIMKLTKQEMLSIAGQCFGTALAFLDVRYAYDYLKATFDILKDENTSFLLIIKDIEAAYTEAETENFSEYSPKTRNF
jgi:L-fucose isomerase-like protein